MGRKNHFVAVSEVVFNEIIEQRPFQASAKVRINPSAGSADFSSALVVDEAKAFRQGDVIFWGKIELLLFAEVINGVVVFFAATHQIGVRKVWKDFNERSDFRFDFLQFGFIFLIRRAEFFDLGEDGFDVTALFLNLRNARGKTILFRFVRFNDLKQL